MHLHPILFRLVKGGVQGRADIIKVKGVLLAPAAIEEVVRSLPELSGEFQVEVSKQGDLDQILLKIELMPGARDKRESVLTRLKDQPRLNKNLGYRVECYPHGTLPRFDVKARRFKDLRH